MEALEERVQCIESYIRSNDQTLATLKTQEKQLQKELTSGQHLREFRLAEHEELQQQQRALSSTLARQTEEGDQIATLRRSLLQKELKIIQSHYVPDEP